MARARPRTVFSGSCDFSKRMDASVRSFNATEVLRTLAAWKFALSSTMRVVSATDGAVNAADDARKRDGAFGVGDHQIGRTERDSASSFSAIDAFSPASARRTKICRPCSLSASKACIGCASSAMT